MAAPGLNENEGRAGDLELLPSPSVVEIINAGSCASIADRGRLPVALEKDEGADEEDDGLAGNTKGGFGGGRAARDDVWEASEERFFNASSTKVDIAYPRAVALSGLLEMGASSIAPGPNVVAIFPTRAAALKRWTTQLSTVDMDCRKGTARYGSIVSNRIGTIS